MYELANPNVDWTDSAIEIYWEINWIGTFDGI